MTIKSPLIISIFLGGAAGRSKLKLDDSFIRINKDYLTVTNRGLVSVRNVLKFLIVNYNILFLFQGCRFKNS